MLGIALLTLVCMITYTVEIVFGLAGTILMVSIMSFFYDAKLLVIYSLLPQITVASIGLWRSPKSVDPRFWAGMVAFAALGAVAGLYLFYYFPPQVFHLLLALAITSFGVYMVLSPRGFRIPPLLARVLDVLAGASQALFGISGPIAMTRLLGTFDDKLVVRNYALAFFLATNLYRLAGYLLNATIDGEVLQMMAISAPFIIITLWYSNHLHFKVNPVVFRRVISWLILGGGISMLVH